MIDKIKFLTVNLHTFDKLMQKSFDFKAEIKIHSSVYMKALVELSFTNMDCFIMDIKEQRQYVINGSVVRTGQNKFQPSSYIEFNPAKFKAEDYIRVYGVAAGVSSKISRVDFCLDLNIKMEVLFNHLVFDKRHVLERQFIGRKFETLYFGSSSGEQIKVYDKIKEMKIKGCKFDLVRIERSIKDIRIIDVSQMFLKYVDKFEMIKYYDFSDLDDYKTAFVNLYGINVFIKKLKHDKTWFRHKDKLKLRKDNLKDLVNKEIENYMSCKNWYSSYNNMYVKNYASNELIERLFKTSRFKDKLKQHIYSKKNITYDYREILIDHYKDFKGLVNFITFEMDYRFQQSNPRNKKIDCLYNNSLNGGVYSETNLNSARARKKLLTRNDLKN